MQELTMNEIEQVNGGSWFSGWLIGTAIGEVYANWRSNPSSYGSEWSNRDLMHAKY